MSKGQGRKKRATPLAKAEPEDVHQKKITAFFAKLPPNSLHLQQPIQRLQGTTSRSIVPPPTSSNKQPKCRRLKKRSRTLTSKTIDPDIIVISSDSDSDDVETVIEVGEGAGNSQARFGNGTDHPVTRSHAVQVQEANIDNDNTGTDEDVEKTEFEMGMVVRRALFTSEEDTQRLDEAGIVDETETQGLLPASPHLNPTSGSPPKTAAVGSEHDSEPENRDESGSPSLLANYRPDPRLFEEEDCTTFLKPTVPDLFTSPRQLSTPTKGFKTPTKAAKRRLPFTSPIRHLGKTTGSFNQTTPKKSLSTFFVPSPDKRPVARMPYFLDNFLKVLDAVATDDFHSHLFNEEDRELMIGFRELSQSTQCLYVRLYNRQWKWKQADSINYPDIALDLRPSFQQLLSQGFLAEIKDENVGLETLLDLLTLDQMGQLGKKVNAKSNTKDKMKGTLLKMAKEQKTLKGNSADVIYKLGLDMVGPTYKVSHKSKSLFARVSILFSPLHSAEDEAENRGGNQALTILLNEIGKMQFPSYTINKVSRIYSSREDLLRFQDALTLHSDIQTHLQAKNWTLAEELVQEARSRLEWTLSDPTTVGHGESLPSFLRPYTASVLYIRAIWGGVDALQKTKQYSKANEVIQYLLEVTRSSYLTHYRGRFHERMVVNAKQHLKASNSQVKDLIKAALADPSIGDSVRLGLSRRLEKVKQKPKGRKRKASAEESKEEEESIPNAYTLKHTIPSRTIQGEKMSVLSERVGGKSVFMGNGSVSGGNPKTMSSVEYYALEHFRDEGYIYGVHGEGGIPGTLFGLLFWDIVYTSAVPDVFFSPFQSIPLDIRYPEFYTQRKHLFDPAIQSLRNEYSIQHVCDIIDLNWRNHCNSIGIVNWTVFESPSHAQRLVRSLGIHVLADICERLANRFSTSGFPDLVVWNDTDCIFVEVKGPGDTLSDKQILWLEFLISIGANAQVCHVKAVSNKRIRVSDF